LPNLLSLTTCCVCPEPRPLPSTGITRLHRYYEPLRHPRAPGPSLAGVRLVIPDHAMGLPVLRALSRVYMPSPLPRRSGWDPICSLTQSYQSSPIAESGRPAHRPFRGLLSVHSRYGLHTRTVTVFRDSFTEGFNRFVTSTVAPVASGWSILPGGTFTHWKAPPFHGAPTKRPFAACGKLMLPMDESSQNTGSARV
jgi:hypothetical protein